jgi:D-sedoheptulose 7-phosphate isomerase
MELTFQSMEPTEQILEKYRNLLVKGFDTLATNPFWPRIQEEFARVRKRGAGVFLAGNGGSAANANHLANDLIYGVNQHGRGAFRVHSLAANPSVLTCLGNDVGFENVFSNQLEALAGSGDLLLVFSGSGNSPNIIQALKVAKKLGVTSVALLGYDGGGAKALADLPIHFPIHDMQAVEDLHMIVGHLLLKSLQ